MDIHFHEILGPFWSYYDEDNGKIVVEFLDAKIISPLVNFPKGLPFLGFKLRTSESKMALTREVTRITANLDRGQGGKQFWSNNVRLVDKSTVRIVIWKEKAAPEKAKKGKSRAIAVSVGASLLVLFAVIAAITL